MDPRITMILIAERQAALHRDAEYARLAALMRQTADERSRRRRISLPERLGQLGSSIRSRMPAAAAGPADRRVTRRAGPCPDVPC